MGVLAGGTAFAQALTVLVLPFLTRLYTPADFSVLAVYISMLGLVSVVACLRLEIAIPIPKQDEDAANVLAIALCTSATTAALLGMATWLYPQHLVELVDQPALAPYLWLLPLGVWLASSYSALQYWATRKKNFTAIAKTRLSQAVGGASTQIGMGWAGISPFGLLLGHMINSGAGVIGLGRCALTQDRLALKSISLSGMRRVFREYDQFPKYSTFDALANTAGTQLPIIIIAAMAIGSEAGFLILAMRVMQAPMSLIGRAVSQVYLSRAPQEYRAGNLAKLTAEVLGGLARTGVGPLLFVGLIAPPVFDVVFGDEWRRAGELVVWMTPWFVFQFLASPISAAMHVRNWQKAMLGLTISSFVLRLGAVGFAAHFDQQHLAEYYSLSSAIFYFACYWTFTYAGGLVPLAAMRIFRRAVQPLTIWVLLGLICRLLLEYLDS